MEICDLPQEGWLANQAVVFTFRPDSAAVRGAALHGGGGQWIDLMVRHRADFPYADLPLEIKGVAPDKRFWIDTVRFPLGTLSSDGGFRWAGRRYSNHYDITHRYRSGIRYAAEGAYAVSIRQLAVRDTLRGIVAVGMIASGSSAVSQSVR